MGLFFTFVKSDIEKKAAGKKEVCSEKRKLPYEFNGACQEFFQSKHLVLVSASIQNKLFDHNHPQWSYLVRRLVFVKCLHRFKSLFILIFHQQLSSCIAERHWQECKSSVPSIPATKEEPCTMICFCVSLHHSSNHSKR